MKKTRHRKIVEIIEKYDVETQDELAGHLKAAGFNVTQATVSRDIKEGSCGRRQTEVRSFEAG